MRIKKWDTVKVISWASRQQWVVMDVDSKRSMVKVEWVNLKCRYKKKSQNSAWQMTKVEYPIHVCKVMLVASDWVPTKVKYDFNKQWKKIRVSKRNWEQLDKSFSKTK